MDILSIVVTTLAKRGWPFPNATLAWSLYSNGHLATKVW